MTMSVYEMQSAVVVPDEPNHELIIKFRPKADDPAINVALPAGAIGQFVVQLAAAHRELSMKSADEAGAFIPLTITGARPFEGQDGTPVLLLQFEKVFELAALLDSKSAGALAAVAKSLHEPSSRAPTRRH